MEFPELSYANAADPPLKRGVIRFMERLAGRNHFAPAYRAWRSSSGTNGDHAIRSLLGLIGVTLEIRAASWPPAVLQGQPLVMVANHPFGILDGLAALSMAEDLGRPFRVLINQELMKVPELGPFALPIDFRETPDAVRTNLRTRNEAIDLLRSGTTIIVFPAGGVATAPSPFGRAVELPWKLFPARMIQAARASVLPVYFEGQCSPLFHIASKISMTLRLSLLIREFKRSVGERVIAHAGDIIPFDELQHKDERRALIGELYARVHALGS